MASDLPRGLRFQEAIDWLRRRVRISTREWRDLLEGAEAAATRIVDEQLEAMTGDLIAAVLDVVESGGTLADFQAGYDRIVRDHGWSYSGESGWHSELIFRMQTANAYSAGRWEQAQRVIAANGGRTKYYFRYVTVGDHRVRDNHARWHGIVLSVDHWFWRSHWTPNGFNCRCPPPQLVSEFERKRRGWEITADTDPRLAIPPDPGFAGNVGMAMLQGQGDFAP